MPRPRIELTPDNVMMAQLLLSMLEPLLGGKLTIIAVNDEGAVGMLRNSGIDDTVLRDVFDDLMRSENRAVVDTNGVIHDLTPGTTH